MADKFRRAKVSRHVRIYHRQMQCEAWRHLSGSAVKVLLAMASLENGDNNGTFFLSARTGATITGLGKNAVNRALHELQEKGFVYCAQRGGFSRKTPHAACWGLTWQAGPKGSEQRAPSHAYEKWRLVKNRGPRNGGNAVLETGTLSPKQALHCPQSGDVYTAEMAENRQTVAVPKSGTHTSYQPLPGVNGGWKQLQIHGGPILPLGWCQPDYSEPVARLAYAASLARQLAKAIRAPRLAA